MLSLALNLLLTGVFIWFVKKLIRSVPERAAATVSRPAARVAAHT